MTRQYIGARYVPKFADPLEWNSGMAYEALTIVTYNYSSYTSKKPVPVGVAPTNSEYWALTGNYNAQLNQVLTGFAELKENFASVTYYGAAGDDETDDTQAFQDMFDDLDAGGFFYIPKGTYLVSSPLSVPSNCTIVCDGVIHSTIDPATERVHKGVFEIVQQKNVNMIGVNIIGNVPDDPSEQFISASPTWYCGIFVDQSDYVRIDKCSIQKFEGGYCILGQYTTNFWVTNCYIYRFKWIGICSHRGCVDVFFINNSVIDPYGRTISGSGNGTVPNSYPIKLSGYDEDPDEYAYHVENVMCIGNYVECKFAWWEGIDAHGGRNLTIADNVIVGSATGIMVSDQNTEDQGKWKMDGCTIRGNTIVMQSFISDIIPAGNCFGIIAGGSNITVADNIMENGGCSKANASAYKGGIYIRAAKGCTVSNNVMSNVCGVGLYFTGDCEDVNIANNTCHFTEDSDIKPYSQNWCILTAYIGAERVCRNLIIHDNTFRCDSKAMQIVRAPSTLNKGHLASSVFPH